MPLYANLDQNITFYIVFQDSVHWANWNAWTRSDFRHCWAFQPCYFPSPGLLANRYVLKFEVTSTRIHTDIWWSTPEEVAASYLESGVTDILKIKLPIRKKDRYSFKGLLTCVSGIKALLGIRAWWILTPRQLHNYLISKGAVSLKGEIQDVRDRNAVHGTQETKT